METEDGWTIAEYREGMTAEEAAELQGGVVIDPGPYESYDEAYDALLSLEEELASEDTSDIPGTRALEGRPESSEPSNNRNDSLR
jgi:hypothetical protein